MVEAYPNVPSFEELEAKSIAMMESMKITDHNSSATTTVPRAEISTSKIELSISCRNLLNRDILSKSDPFCVVWLRESGGGAKGDSYRQIGQTEMIRDDLNPKWAKKIFVDYCFEMHQELKFEVWDYDSQQKNEDLGEHSTTLAVIVARSGVAPYTAPLRRNQQMAGEIIIECEEMLASKLHFNFEFSLSKSFMDSIYCCGILSPTRSNAKIVVLSRANESGSWTVVYRSEKIEKTNTHESHFNVDIGCHTLCNGDFERSIKIEVFHWRRNGKHSFLGHKVVSVSELIGSDLSTPEEDSPKRRLITFNPAKQISFSSKKIGEIQNNNIDLTRKAKPNKNLLLNCVQITEQFSFLDYVRAGMQVHFAVAIDFTASNLEPDNPSSLHYLDPSGKVCNQYEMALRAVGEIIEPYDKIKMLPAFGFGAKLRSDYERNTAKVLHQFPLNGNSSHPYVSNLSELLFKYRLSLSEYVLSGPTNFGPVIRNTALIARQFSELEGDAKKRGQHYFVLLIITDGIISDFDRTVDEIIDASTLPLSIIIIGVGDTNFDSMRALDSDAQVLQSGTRRAARDIVQFVPLKEFLSQDSRTISSTASLSAEVLEEIPGQIRAYMAQSGIEPSEIQRVRSNVRLP